MRRELESYKYLKPDLTIVRLVWHSLRFQESMLQEIRSNIKKWDLKSQWDFNCFNKGNQRTLISQTHSVMLSAVREVLWLFWFVSAGLWCSRSTGATSCWHLQPRWSEGLWQEERLVSLLSGTIRSMFLYSLQQGPSLVQWGVLLWFWLCYKIMCLLRSCMPT